MEPVGLRAGGETGCGSQTLALMLRSQSLAPAPRVPSQLPYLAARPARRGRIPLTEGREQFKVCMYWLWSKEEDYLPKALAMSRKVELFANQVNQNIDICWPDLHINLSVVHEEYNARVMDFFCHPQFAGLGRYTRHSTVRQIRRNSRFRIRTPFG